LIKYKYKKLSPKWQLYFIQVKLKSEGLEPEFLSADPSFVWLNYNQKLSDSDKRKLDTLMNDINIGLYPASKEGFTVIVINDLFDAWEQLETDSGVPIKWIFACVPFHDKIEIWVEGKLTPKQVKSLFEAYSKLWQGKKK